MLDRADWTLMDGRGRWIDNVFIEHVWRSLKHEDIYLKATPTAARPRPGSPAGSPSRLLQRATSYQALGYRASMPSGARRQRRLLWQQQQTTALAA
jgi:hypothetical protein